MSTTTPIQPGWPVKPVIMAIIQFSWFNLGQNVNVKFARNAYQDPALWARFMATSKSGKRLQQVFKDRYPKILWRQANADKKRTDPTDPLDYDLDHISKIMTTYDPEFVLLFGDSACTGFRKHIHQLPYIGMYVEADHPGKEASMPSLVAAAAGLSLYLEKHNLTL